MLHNYPTLFVSWRSPSTRSIHPVGRLKFVADPKYYEYHYEYRYIRSARRAAKEGFTPFPDFPKLENVYRDKELFPMFSNRSMSDNRPGFASFLEALGLSAESANPMAILARTGGRRVTDQIELFPEPSLEADGCYVTHCLLRSIRYMPQPGTDERIAKLKVEEQLYWMPDPQNPVDPYAVAVRTIDNYMVGYVPSYLTADLRLLKAECPDVKLFVSRVNHPPAEAHHRLLVKIVSCRPPGFQPFQTDDYLPIGVG